MGALRSAGPFLIWQVPAPGQVRLVPGVQGAAVGAAGGARPHAQEHRRGGQAQPAPGSAAAAGGGHGEAEGQRCGGSGKADLGIVQCSPARPVMIHVRSLGARLFTSIHTPASSSTVQP